MTDRHEEPRKEAIVELIDQLSNRTQRLRSVEREREEFARQLAHSSGASQATEERRTGGYTMRRLLRGALRRIVSPPISGFLDHADCITISGWASDSKDPHKRLTIEILDGQNVVTTVVADRHRPDLVAAGLSDASHGFRIPTPNALKDGKLHVVWARVAGTKFTLEGGPRRITCQPMPDDLLVASRAVGPVSRRWGVERGTPLDRRYVEGFLSRQSNDIRGRVLEIGNNVYTTRFGGDHVSSSDVLNVLEGVPGTTIVADLADAPVIPADSFDAAIVTQTLQLIYDVRAAIRTLHRILKPGGVVLVTVPGITPMGDVEWGASWYWSFTELSIRTLFEEFFPSENVSVESHGNVLAAASFLYGLTAEDLTLEELDVHDPIYPVTITVRAVKEGMREGSRAPKATGTATATQPATVLLYHRVANVDTDPWQNAVDPARFAEHLDALSDRTDIVALSELDDVAGRRRRRPAVAITFDDGYEDNLLAREALTSRGIPATFFVVSGSLGSEFWWDELERLLLGPGVLNPQLRLSIEGQWYTWEVGQAAEYTDAERSRNAGWRAMYGPDDPTPRHSIFRSVHALLMPLAEAERAHAMDQIRDWVSRHDAPGPTARALSAEELVGLASDSNVEIGAHTVSHPALPSLHPSERRREIEQSKHDLEGILESRIRLFAYPFGITDPETSSMVRESGFDRAWVIGTPSRSDDLMRLERLFVADWSGDELIQQICARQT